MTTVQPVQLHDNKRITGNDITITAGGTLLGAAAGTITGYNLKPTADQYVKAAIDISEQALHNAENIIAGFIAGSEGDSSIGIQGLKKHLNDMGINYFDDITSLSEFKDRTKRIVSEQLEVFRTDEFKNELKEQFKNFDNETKNSLKPMVRKSNMIKWGAIGAGVAALVTAGVLFLAKNNDNKTKQA